MGRDAYLQSALPSMQLEKLVVEPLEAVIYEQEFPLCVVVIDTLDECKEENMTSMILMALSFFVSCCSPIKSFITSCPIANVVNGFHRTGLIQYTNSLALHSLPLDISQRDIRNSLEACCPSRRQIQHIWLLLSSPQVPPARSGMLELGCEFVSSKDIQLQLWPSNFRRMAHSWHLHLGITAYVCGMYTLSSRRARTLSLPTLHCLHWVPYLQPSLTGLLRLGRSSGVNVARRTLSRDISSDGDIRNESSGDIIISPDDSFLALCGQLD